MARGVEKSCFCNGGGGEFKRVVGVIVNFLSPEQRVCVERRARVKGLGRAFTSLLHISFYNLLSSLV